MTNYHCTVFSISCILGSYHIITVLLHIYIYISSFEYLVYFIYSSEYLLLSIHSRTVFFLEHEHDTLGGVKGGRFKFHFTIVNEKTSIFVQMGWLEMLRRLIPLQLTQIPKLYSNR